VVPRLPKAVIVSSASMKVFKHESFILPEKRPLMSVPLNAWNAGNAASLTLPRALARTKANHTMVITRNSDKRCIYTQLRIAP